ncbi:RNA methyltransferase [Nonomuraea helvata]|uniref:RNA methyltransferase n=1 Tax=Nonomuraea helvata TaxID=37484 RepID=A0ABV5S2S2_9ACTN
MHTFAVARAVHGIEPLVATEIRRSRLGVVRGVRHREVWFEASPGADLMSLRTADDLLLAAAVVDGIGHDRSALRRLARAVRAMDVDGFAHPGSAVEVSASFVGRRNYTRFEIEDAVGAELARPLRLPYHSRKDGARPPRDAMSWRVTIEGDQALIALRPAARPLHRRAYKTASIRGTLHPPVAAAMAALARLGDAGTVLDPCCGAGTTLIEAHALAPGARLLGFDHDPAALHAAASNARTAGSAPPPAGCFHGERAAHPSDNGKGRGLFANPRSAEGRASFGWAAADAGRIPMAGGGADRVLVNPPWGRQVPPRGLLARDLGPLWREVRRVLADDGVAVALVHDEIPPGFAVEEAVRVSLSGRHPVIAVLRKARR